MSTEVAELVITGARIRCGRRGGVTSWASALAVRGDRVVRLGRDDDMTDLIGAHTRVVTGQGRLVLPGFQDAHVHAPFAGRNQLRLWLNDTVGRAAYLDQISAYAAAHPDEPWILGGGWAMEYFPGGTPRKEDLDAVVPDRPVFLFNRDVHGAWVNSRALEVGGIHAGTPDPSDGRIERDSISGEPSGTLHEGAAYWFNDTIVPTPSTAEWRASILQAHRHLHGLGITGWQDAWVTPGTLAAYRELAVGGELTARVVGALWWDRHRGLDQIDDLLTQREGASNAASPDVLGAGFHPTTVKIMTDGVLENHTGALLEPYCDGCGGHSDNHGLSYVDPDLLAEAVAQLDAHGFQVHLHAIGDRAARMSLDAISVARERNGANDLRHHIAHLQVLQPADIPRFAELGVVANCQAYWAQSEPQMDELTIPFLGPERAVLQYPFAALRASGARLAMGSDWAVTTANPLEQIEVAVNRVDPDHRDRAAFLPQFALGLDEALDAFTAGSAYVNHDAEAGELRVGARADVVMLDTDICAPAFGHGGRLPVADATVDLTVASGAVVHERMGTCG